MTPNTPNTNEERTGDDYSGDTGLPGDDDGNDINDGQGLEIADPNDFIHRRDSDDQLQPVVQQVPGRDEALRVVPPTTGDFQKYHLDDPEALYEDDALYAEFLNEHFPDLDHVTAQDVEQGMIAYGAEMFVDVAQRAGGKDMKDALDERDMKRMLEMIGDGDGNVDFQKLVQAGQEMDQ